MSQQQRAAPLSRHLTLSVYCRLWRLWPSGTGYFVMSALAIAVGSVVGQAVARCESIASQVQLIRVCSLAAFDLFALLANALSLSPYLSDNALWYSLLDQVWPVYDYPSPMCQAGDWSRGVHREQHCARGAVLNQHRPYNLRIGIFHCQMTFYGLI